MTMAWTFDDEARVDVPAAGPDTDARVAVAVAEHPADVLHRLRVGPGGLDPRDVELRRVKYGDNVVTHEKRAPLARRILSAFINPFTAILLVLAVVSAMTDIVFPLLGLFGGEPADADGTAVAIIVAMVAISGTLRFVQESRSGDAAERLLSLISMTCSVVRDDGVEREIPMDDLVVGDIVRLSAGDMVPADMRIFEAKDLFVSQASLTGESEPVEKVADAGAPGASPSDAPNFALMGSNVISGTARGVVVRTGDDTMFGAMARSVAGEAAETSFPRGVNAVSWVLVRFMMVMVPVVFVINGITKGDWLAAFLFGISIAVGLTPEMLPMIVTTSLAKGAVAMSRKKTIVKNLNSIQNFGAIDVLCTDKTGTLTRDKVVLQYHLNIAEEEDSRVLRYAYLNSYFQTGYRNAMDQAIIARTEEEEAADPELVDLSEHYEKIDEIPFDFSRRRLSAVVRNVHGTTRLVTKGAVEEMLAICDRAEFAGHILPLGDEVRRRILDTVDGLNAKGFRVLAIAQKPTDAPPGAFGVDDERDMILIGYLAFLDPPKDSAADAIAALAGHGVDTRILTGDNERVTRTICRQVGMDVGTMLLGPDIEAMTDAELAEAVRDTRVFAKLTRSRRSASSPSCANPASSSGSWATASTTPARCGPPTSASPSTPPSTSRRTPPTSCCWRRTSWSWSRASSRAAAPTRT